MKVEKRLSKASENENQSSYNWINTESPKPRKKQEEWSSSKQKENEHNLFTSLRPTDEGGDDNTAGWLAHMEGAE